MSKEIIFSQEKPNVIDMLNKHIDKTVDPIRAMNIEQVEIHVEILRWELKYSIERLKKLGSVNFNVTALETSESVLERIKKRTPKRTKGQGKKKRTAREKLLALGIYTDEQIEAMGVK